MTEKQFEQLVRRLEVYAQHHPARYKAKVALLAITGYAYVLFVLGTVIALALECFFLIHNGSSGKAVLLKLGIGLIILATVIVRALWVRLQPPTGIEVRREQAPRLFLLIDKLTEALDTPPFHHVLMVNDHNAAVVQIPRLGVFGWHRNYLLLGLPLMLTTTPRQFRAVLAHEFGHLGRQHGRFSVWIYRARVTWSRLLHELTSRNHWASGVFTKFLGWYAPFFNGYSFVLARAQEYEADRNAARLVGPQCMKDALASIAVGGRMLGEFFWSALDRRTSESATPPASHLTELAMTITLTAHRDRTQTFFNEEMNVSTGYADTHPSLADRLAALSRLPIKKTPADTPPSIPQLLGVEEIDSAQHYLGPLCDELRDRLDREWVEDIRATWKQKHEERVEAQTRREALAAKAASHTLTPPELWEHAQLVEWLDGPEAAIPLLQQLLAAAPTHAAGNFALGRLLLTRGERQGLQFLEQALTQDQDIFLSVCQLAEQFLERTGHHKEARTYRERASERRELMDKAEEERQRVAPKDEYIPHGLPEDTITTLTEQLASIPEIGDVYLARKRVTVFPEVPSYALIVVPRYRWYEWREDAKNQSLLARLTQGIPLPPSTYVLVLGSNIKRSWRKTLKHIPALPIPHVSSRSCSSKADSVLLAPALSSVGGSLLYRLKRRWPEITVVAVVLVILSNFSSHPTPNCTDQPQTARPRPIGRGKLYFVPIGDIPATTVAGVATYYSKVWNIPLETLAPLELDEVLWDRDQDRGQLIAERVTVKMQRHYAALSWDPEAILIGLTAVDMYREQSSSWRFVFSHREGGRYAVVSSARMHPRVLPLHLPHGSLLNLDKRDNHLMHCRLRKMVGKNVGMLYYRLPTNKDPTSLLYDSIGGPDDLDRITERF